MKKQSRPLPKMLDLTRAIDQAKLDKLYLQGAGGKLIQAFNGSQNNKRNKKRPITLADRA